MPVGLGKRAFLQHIRLQKEASKTVSMVLDLWRLSPLPTLMSGVLERFSTGTHFWNALVSGPPGSHAINLEVTS